jgi:hypothetical protein
MIILPNMGLLDPHKDVLTHLYIYTYNDHIMDKYNLIIILYSDIISYNRNIWLFPKVALNFPTCPYPRKRKFHRITSTSHPSETGYIMLHHVTSCSIPPQKCFAQLTVVPLASSRRTPRFFHQGEQGMPRAARPLSCESTLFSSAAYVGTIGNPSVLSQQLQCGTIKETQTLGRLSLPLKKWA